MGDEEIRRSFLGDILERKNRGEHPLILPLQYAEVFGVSVQVAEANLEYMTRKGWIRAEMQHTATERYMMVQDINPLGIDHLSGLDAAPAPFDQTNQFQGVKDSLAAMGGHGVQVQSSEISTFQELYSYLDRNLSREQVRTLERLLDDVQAQIRYGSVKTSTLKKIAALSSQYGPPVATALDFIARQLGLKGQ